MVYLVFDPVPLSSEMEGLLRRRKFALLHLRFRRRLLASLALFVALVAVVFVAVIALDYASSVAVEGADYYGSNDSNADPLAPCRIWFFLEPRMTTLDDPVRSCSVESALLRLDNVDDDAAVCVVTGESAAPQVPIQLTHRFKELQSLEGSSGDYGRLVHISPSHASAFASTALESLHVSLQEFSAVLRPALAWALLWKYGGTFVSPDVVLTLEAFDSYSNFVWFDGGARGKAKGISLDLFRFEEARQDLPLRVLHHFSVQGGRGLNLSLSNEDWTRIVESYCGRRVFQEEDPGLCQNVEILGKTAVVATSSLAGKMRNAASAAPVQEVVAVIVDDRADGLDVLSVLPAEVCPDTTRRYLAQPER